jgi:CBS domain-containing protein
VLAVTSTAVDPVTFLRATEPFSGLPDALFDEAAAALEVTWHPAGTRLCRAGGEPMEHLYVIRKGVVRLERDGQTLQLAEEGESVGDVSLISQVAALDAVVEEELVAYRIPAATFQRLLGDARFASHFAAKMGGRLEASLDHAPVSVFRTDFSREVQQLVRRPAVWVDVDVSVGEAAAVMAEQRISSVLVRTDPPTLVTDRDFRNAVLAEELGPETPVAAVPPGPVHTIPATTPIHEAWLTLIDRNVDHLAVERNGAIVGVLAASDLLKSAAQGPVAVLRSVERLPGREQLPGYAARVGEMAAALVSARLDATVVAGFVARLNDVLLRRIVRWAERDLGAAPAPWVWLALGSEGRMEQTLLTDQDNALVFADAGAPHRTWFQSFAERINDDLEAAGFPRCSGGYMAKNWNGTISEWIRRFDDWTDSPQPRALLEAAIFFDYRRVEGPLDLAPLDAAVAGFVDRPVFLRFLARQALDFKPPPSLLLRLRGDAPAVDLKLHAVAPIVHLARCYGIEARASGRGTLERLEAAVHAGLADPAVIEAVCDAFRFVLGLRLRLQLRRIAEGRHPDDGGHAAMFSAVERGHLKGALRAIRLFQERATFHYRADF